MKLPRQAIFREVVPAQLRSVLQWLWEDLVKVVNTNDRMKTVGPLIGTASDYGLKSEDEMLLVDATSADVTVTLPQVASVPRGKMYSVKKIDSTAHIVHITGDANIDGSASLGITSQYVSYTLQSDGSKWWIK